MGLTVSVYKHPRYNCTNGGISADVDELTVVNVDGPFDPRPGYPAVMLVEGAAGTAIIVPAFDISENPRCVHCGEGVASTVTDGTGRENLPEIIYHVAGNATSCYQNQLNVGSAEPDDLVGFVAEIDPTTVQASEWIPLRKPDQVGPMAGGHYAGTSDGRFSAAVEKILGSRFYGAVPIHDRFETVAQYEALST